VARLENDPADYFRRELSRKSRVLLVNPPVHERRYHWLRWNQPSDLLRLSTWLRTAHKGIDVRLFDFMFPDATGSVKKHKVKETWTGSERDRQLWHFGRPFEEFEAWIGSLIQREKWTPDCIVVTSLTSYWHEPIEKLLPKVCTRLGRKARERADIVLYGNYPRIEPEHASGQLDADVAFTSTVDTRGSPPDWTLYEDVPPLFYGLDVAEPNLLRTLEGCWTSHTQMHPKVGRQKPPAMTIAFLNDDIWCEGSRIEDVVKFRRDREPEMAIDGIAGIVPLSLTAERLGVMKEAGFRSLFVEHARLDGGALDAKCYEALREALEIEEHQKRIGVASTAWLDGAVTGFVAVGLPGDDMDCIVQTTLELNSYFQSIIMKPFGYSPTFDPSSAARRRELWSTPADSSPQRFPYVGRGSKLTLDDYSNLLAWQNLLNKRVKGATFDFLGRGLVPRLVRETLVGESWKPQGEDA
jgi:hypothetical protein